MLEQKVNISIKKKMCIYACSEITNHYKDVLWIYYAVDYMQINYNNVNEC